MAIPHFIVKFGIIILPLFLIRSLAARYICRTPKSWVWIRKISFNLWIPYYESVEQIYSLINWLRGESPTKFKTIADAIPWTKLASTLCLVKENFYRNRLLAVLDLIYPISTLSNLSESDRKSLRLLPPGPSKLNLNVINAGHDLWHELRYASEFATYVYFLGFLGKPRGVKIVLGPYLPRETSSNTFDPGYFVALDEINKRLILCIRGSSTLGDFGTDIDAIPTKMIHVAGSNGSMTNYAVHRGIWLAARRLDARIKDSLIQEYNKLKSKYPKLEITICGHSLGAGVTSLLGIIWYYGLTDGMSEESSLDIRNKFYCYSFASPPVIDANGRDFLLKYMRHPETGQRIITSVVNQVDIVTRMSIPGLVDASNKLEWIGDDIKRFDIINKIEERRCQPIARRQSIENIIKSKKPLSPGKEAVFNRHQMNFINKFCKFQNVDDLNLKPYKGNEKIKKQKKYIVLYPCGVVIWRMPALPWDKLKKSFKQLTTVTNSENMAVRIITWILRMFYDVFAEVDSKGNYKKGKYDCERYFSKFEMYKMDGENVLNDFDIFKNMVINSGSAVLDHLPGQYSAMFGNNLITIFKKSSRVFAAFIPDKQDFFIVKIIKYMIAIPLFILGWVYTMVVCMFQ